MKKNHGGGGGQRQSYICLIIMATCLSSLPFFLIHGQLEIFHADKIVSKSTTLFQRGFVIPKDVPSSFCHLWSSADAANHTLQNFDEWYTHHPHFRVVNETEDMFCVETYCKAVNNTYHCPDKHTHNILNDTLAFYSNQFESSCDRVHYRSMWSSGWAADFLNVQEGLIYANDFSVPLVMSAPWHYAALKKDPSIRTCPQADLTCYFLPYHSCPNLDVICGFTREGFGGSIEECNGTKVERFTTTEQLHEIEVWYDRGLNAYNFMTRKQLWLRRAVFDFKREFQMKQEVESDCSAIHVRRSDVIFHDEWSRKYYPVSDYVNLIPKEKLSDPNHTIFLLTDDSNAIKEAHEFHPHLRWKYIDRPRHHGSSGGWENQTPSGVPSLELITLMAIFELVQDCSVFVHGQSGLSDYIWTHMAANAGNKAVTRLRVDNGKQLFNETFAHSEKELANLLAEKRRKKEGR